MMCVVSSIWCMWFVMCGLGSVMHGGCGVLWFVRVRCVVCILVVFSICDL